MSRYEVRYIGSDRTDHAALERFIGRHKERLWLSPSCRGARQGTMWEVGS